MRFPKLPKTEGSGCENKWGIPECVPRHVLFNLATLVLGEFRVEIHKSSLDFDRYLRVPPKCAFGLYRTDTTKYLGMSIDVNGRQCLAEAQPDKHCCHRQPKKVQYGDQLIKESKFVLLLQLGEPFQLPVNNRFLILLIYTPTSVCLSRISQILIETDELSRPPSKTNSLTLHYPFLVLCSYQPWAASTYNNKCTFPTPDHHSQHTLPNS